MPSLLSENDTAVGTDCEWAAEVLAVMADNIFITQERRAWMRLRSHTVVFDRDPEFVRYLMDPSGSVLSILRIWVAETVEGQPVIRYYVGSIRHCDCGGWMSRDELRRLFRHATVIARLVGERAKTFRGRLSRFLRDYFSQGKQPERLAP
jgi:hypothetical protein